MQMAILKNKNKIAVVSAILIVTGLAGKLVFNNEMITIVSFIIASVIGAAPIAIQAYQSLRIKVVSIDVLVTIAVVGAFFIKNFEESAIVTFLFLFGAYLEQRTLNKTRSAIRELTEMAPESALKKNEEGEFEEVDVDDVEEGDILLVKTGAKVPVDGVVISGEGHINEASITGESLPVEKNTDSKVFAGTILENGTLTIKTDKVGEDTTFGKIIELVEEAQDSKSEAERFIDRFSKYYTPAVLIMALIVFLVSRNIELAITMLVLGCPGALVIGVPVSNVAGIGNGAKNGILLKGSEVIGDFSKADTMVFDKTGTLTIGNPKVSETGSYAEDMDEAIDYLISIEKESDHPLAKAIVDHFGKRNDHKVENTNVYKGGGVSAMINGRNVAVGNKKLMDDLKAAFSEDALKDIKEFQGKGDSIVIEAIDGKIAQVVGIRDQIRPGVKESLKKLKGLGIKNLILLSGDNQKTVELVSNELGLTEAHGNMLPENKSEFIEKLQKDGHKVAFVGDGVNDSPSLALSNVGIAMGNGTDVAIETSDVVLMNSDFNKLPHALGLVKATALNMKENIAAAIGVVVVLLLGLFFSNLVNMSVGMLVHEGSILAVIINGMRLLRYKLR
jgi:Cd2+/Zn2+-exporting ATPase